VLLARLRRLLRERFHEPDLDPTTLACAAGISKRHLHGIFANAGTSFGRELNELRLQRGESLLRDASYAARHISEIAYRVGFADPSHFARRFRARYGASPATYRDLRR
jgi:AraC-like DNA-binding protein